MSFQEHCCQVLPPDEMIEGIEASRTRNVCILCYRFSTCLGAKLDGDLRKAWKIQSGSTQAHLPCEVKVSHPYQEELSQLTWPLSPDSVLQRWKGEWMSFQECCCQVLPPDETFKEIEASRTGSVCILRYRFSNLSIHQLDGDLRKAWKTSKQIYTSPPPLWGESLISISGGAEPV